jgi:rare lipoprotein A
MRALLAALIVCLFAIPARAEMASCYGNEHHQVRTATGAPYNPWRLTAAHRQLPFGTRVRVTYRGRSVVVTVNDRGPFVRGRSYDLSLGACRALGFSLGRVTAEVLR